MGDTFDPLTQVTNIDVTKYNQNTMLHVTKTIIDVTSNQNTIVDVTKCNENISPL